MNPVRRITATVCLALGVAIPGKARAAGRLVADFEEGRFQGWTAVGRAFGEGPERTPADRPGIAGGYHGTGRASSARGGDHATGLLRSDPVRVDHRHLRLLLAGPPDPRRGGVRVLAAGRVIAVAAGRDPSALTTVTLDLGAHLGREVTIEVYDDDPAPGGVVVADQFVLEDTAATPPEPAPPEDPRGARD